MEEFYRCTCADVPDAPSDGCMGDFWSLNPQRFCGDPICPPCWDHLQELLRRLSSKGVTVEGAA